MSMNKAAGHTERNQRILFRLVDTAGTPSITGVSPAHVAGDVSVVDTAAGRATITIKNFKGPQGIANIILTPHTTSLMCAAVSRSYSGDNLSFEISTENDASALTDSSVDCQVEVF